MQKKPVHSGHRNRMKNKFIASEFDNFNDHEIIELLLYYSVPRVDTNPIAHELLDRFGSISGILDASVESLREFGLTERAAVFLNMLPQISQAYFCDKNYNLSKSFNEPQFKKRLITYFLHCNEKVVLLALYDAAGIELFFGPIKNDDPQKLISRFSDLAIKYNSGSAVICTRNEYGLAFPSHEDIETINLIREGLGNISVRLKNWYVVSGTDITSLAEVEDLSFLFFNRKIY